jgi:Bacterial lectin/Domain of unknown function (DUF1929)
MVQGSWSAVLPWPEIAIHSVLLPNGDVLTFGTNQDGDQGTHKIYDIWDPATGLHTTLTDRVITDEFCSAAELDPTTGNVIIVGGDGRPNGNVNLGVRDVNVFDYRTDSLTASATGALNLARWYPTMLYVGNGHFLTLGGESDAGMSDSVSFNGTTMGGGQGMPEIYTPGTGWHNLTGAYSQDISYYWYYPRAWLSSSGAVFGFDLGDKNGAVFGIGTNGAGTYYQYGTTPFEAFTYNPSVEYAPDKILTVDWSGRAWIMDISGPAPVFTETNGIGEGRAWSNLTDLADGTVLLTGGSVNVMDVATETNNAMIWNPDTGEWTNDASAAIGRFYHSTTLLLADGTVLSGGGGAPGPLMNLSAEIYTPGYLLNPDGSLRTDRPIITSAPSSLEQGQTFTITLDNTAVIQKLELIKFGDTTHSFNQAQDVFNLPFTVLDAHTLQITLPANVDSLSDGYWLLFADNANGTPSVAATIKIGGAGIDVYSPQFKTTLTTGGTTEHTNGSVIYQLTEDSPHQVGTLMSDQRLDLGHDFNVQFSVQFSGGPVPADGLSFVLHNDPSGTSAMGGDGSGFGSAGLRNGLALNFDVYDAGQGTPQVDVATTNGSQQLTGPSAAGNLADGNWHAAMVNWNAVTQTLEYYLDGVKIGQLQGNIVTQYLGGSQYAYFGFTGATGGLSTQISVGLGAMPYATFEPAANVPVDHPNDGTIVDVVNIAKALTLNGSATYDTAHAALVLTPDAADKAGSAYLSNKVDLTHDFNVEFSVYFNPTHQADGIAFLLQNDPNGANALGGTGSGLGAIGVQNGLAIRFDTYGTDTTSLVTSADNAALTNAIGVPNIADGGWHQVGVSWNAETQTLQYWIDGTLKGALDGDIAAQYLGNQTSAYLGFTGGSGASTGLQQVRIGAIDATLAGTSYADHQDVAALSDAATVNGSATYSGTNHVFTLTDGGQNERASAFLGQRVDLSYNFVVSFDVNFGANANGADGMAFVIANGTHGTGALGGSGGGYGAAGIHNGVGIAFDTFSNAGEMAVDHSNFFVTQTSARISDQTKIGTGNVKDGAWHNVVVSWSAVDHTLTYWFDGQKGQTLTEDLSAKYINGSQYAYLGFTGGTGGLSSDQQVHLDSLTAWFEGQSHLTAPELHA